MRGARKPRLGILTEQDDRRDGVPDGYGAALQHPEVQHDVSHEAHRGVVVGGSARGRGRGGRQV